MKIVAGAIKPEILPLSYEFGGMTPVEQKILFPNSDCIGWLPEDEQQIGVYFDDWGCVSRSFLNGIETLIAIQIAYMMSANKNWLFQNIYLNNKPNFSDRDLIVLSETKPNIGNSGQKVLETAQKKGIIAEHLATWDFKSRDPEENCPIKYYLYGRTPISDQKAREWNDRFQITGEFVGRENWKEASKYGVLQVYVNAWHKNKDGKYYNPTGSINHAVIMCDYDNIKIYDSYPEHIKELRSWEDAYYWALKINIIEKTHMKPKITNNSLVILVEGQGGIGLYLDDKIIVDDEAKINSVFMTRNSKNNFFSGGPTISLTQEQWNMFDKVNLKNEPI
jgi:hypothetical protein